MDADPLATARVGLELHLSHDHAEDRVVAAEADVLARMELRAALADDDLARRHELAVKPLDAQHLRVAVAAVLGTADSLLMSHGRFAPPQAPESTVRLVQPGRPDAPWIVEPGTLMP